MEPSPVHLSTSRLSRPKLLQGMSKIKPEMMQKVLSSISFGEEKKTERNVTNPIKLMELFPEKTTINFTTSSSESRTDTDKSKETQTLSQLTIFYNGAVNVYNLPDDKAEKVMKLADVNFSKKSSTKPDKEGANKSPTLKAASSTDDKSPKPSGGLAMVRKLSLQRFLEKRKDRLASVEPFASSKAKTFQAQDLNLSLVASAPPNV